MSKELKPHSYYDYPDGQDVLQKLWCILKPTALVAFGISTADVMLYSHPKGYMKTLGRYAVIGLPLIGVSTVFVLTTNLSASLRKKDDKVNWFAGGAAAGSIFGVWAKRPIIGFNMAMLLGFLALTKKYCDQQGYILTPPNDVPIASGNIWSVNQDWSLTRHRPGNWTTGKE